MGTIVTVDVPGGPDAAASDVEERTDRAFRWFREVEHVCSRFEPESEVQRLTRRAGEQVAVSPLLFEAVRFALTVAEESDGAFDPTVGARLERLGFNSHHLTRETVATPGVDETATWRDVRVDESSRTIALARPLLLDLGGVAKGLALDLAARELAPLGSFAIDAGGDMFVGGPPDGRRAWTIGIRHPDRDDVLLDRVEVRECALCTSGTYERRSATTPDARHVVDPRDGSFPADVASVTVIASSAMLADALATAVLVLGVARGTHLLDRFGVCGLLFTTSGERMATKGCPGDVFVGS